MGDRASVTLRPKLPGLDGLRAFAVVLVVLGHYAPRPWPISRAFGLGRCTRCGHLLCCQFLITHLLLREEESLGSFNLPLFYARRAVRILPALFVLFERARRSSARRIDVHSVRRCLRWPAVCPGIWLARATRRDISGLAIEEQFYLVWPLVLMIGGKSMRLASVTALVIAAPIWRRLATTGPDFINPSRTDLRLLPILCGCLLALALHASAQTLDATVTRQSTLAGRRMSAHRHRLSAFAPA